VSFCCEKVAVFSQWSIYNQENPQALPRANAHVWGNRTSPLPNCRRTASLIAFDPPFRRESDIYAQHLLRKQRGFPLYIPEPNRRLSIEYRRQGVNIGDVGIITPSGAFSFLFNICLPASHPVNPPTLPEGFQPLNVDPLHIQHFSDLRPRSYLASASVERFYSGSTPS